MKILVDKNYLGKGIKSNSTKVQCMINEFNPGVCYTPFCFSKCIVYRPNYKVFNNIYPAGKNNIK